MSEEERKPGPARCGVREGGDCGRRDSGVPAVHVEPVEQRIARAVRAAWKRALAVFDCPWLSHGEKRDIFECKAREPENERDHDDVG